MPPKRTPRPTGKSPRKSSTPRAVRQQISSLSKSIGLNLNLGKNVDTIESDAAEISGFSSPQQQHSRPTSGVASLLVVDGVTSSSGQGQDLPPKQVAIMAGLTQGNFQEAKIKKLGTVGTQVVLADNNAGDFKNQESPPTQTSARGVMKQVKQGNKQKNYKAEDSKSGNKNLNGVFRIRFKTNDLSTVKAIVAMLALVAFTASMLDHEPDVWLKVRRRCAEAFSSRSPLDSSKIDEHKDDINTLEPLGLVAFKATLNSEDQGKLSTFIEDAFKFCSSNINWHPWQGTCVNLPNLAGYHLGARVESIKHNCSMGNGSTEVLAKTREVMLGQNRILSGMPLHPGSGYALCGSESEIVIKIPFKTIIFGIAISHPPAHKLPSGYSASAPHKVELQGLTGNASLDPISFGSVNYKISASSAQVFFFKTFYNHEFDRVKIVIHSNHGNPVYTTLYNLEIYGLEKYNQPWFHLQTESSDNSSKINVVPSSSNSNGTDSFNENIENFRV